MLNMQSKKWSIAARRSMDDQHYLTIRELNKTPKGETIKSSLYQIDSEYIQTIQEKLSDPIIQYETASHIPERLTAARKHGKIIDAKNEWDVQELIHSIVPPLSVYEGTHMLMQDSINIFELPPQQRIDIFKNIFGLLGIDEAKEKISEEKRSLSAMIKTRQDTSRIDTVARQQSNVLITQRPTIEGIITEYMTEKNKSYDTRWLLIYERSLLQEHITIESLTLPDTLPDIDHLETLIDTRHHRLTSIQSTMDGLDKEIQTLQRSIHEWQHTIDDDSKTLQQLQTQLQNYDSRKVAHAQEILEKYQSDLDARYAILPRWSRGDITHKLLTASLPAFTLLDLPTSIESKSISTLWQLLQEVKSHGKTLQAEKNLIEQSQTSWQQQKKWLQAELDRSNERVSSFTNDIESQKIFRCERIQDNCPYIDMINSATFKKLQTQLDGLTADRDRIMKQMEQTTQAKQTYTVAHIDQAITALRDRMTAIDWKYLEELKSLEEQKKNEWEKLQRDFQTLIKEQWQLQRISEQITSLETKVSHTKKEIEGMREREIERSREKEKYSAEIASLPSPTIIHEQKRLLHDYSQSLDRLSHLVSEYKQSQHEINTLKDQEKILGDLYQIFSKELLFIVVRNSLPILQEIINSRLSTVVDYQITMEIDKTSATSDKIELVVTVHDEKWAREVKSLSGWQKVILKLAWMMAVAVFNRSQMLFLDETVNNLDHDTVAKVANLLTQFIEWSKGAMQVYLVSHSAQIQEMPIRDGIVEVQWKSNDKEV